MTVDINIYGLNDTDGRYYLLPTYLEGIQGAMTFMKKVIYEKELFSTTYRTISGRQMTTISSLGKHFKNLFHYGRLFSKNYQFSPLIKFFFEEYREHPIKDYLPITNGHDSMDAEIFDDFVATMRKHAKEKYLKKIVADWESKSKKNSKRLDEFQVELFRRCGRVMAIRLDFNYHKAIFSSSEIDQVIVDAERQKEGDQADYLAGQDISTPRVVEGRIALEEVQKDRKRLFANMKGKPSLFEHLVGYVWRIECGRAAGYHLHVMFFFDGAYHQKHEYFGQEIGCYWRDVITQGRGYFENCNREKEKYGDSWALGEIGHWDIAKRGKLSTALQYFCKTNQLVQVVPYAGCHLFGCGFVHRQRPVRGGRPRTKGVVGSDHQRL